MGYELQCNQRGEPRRLFSSPLCGIEMGTRAKTILIVILLGIYVASAVQVIHKAKNKRTAFLRWTQYTERLSRGEVIYDAEMEQYPNLPMMALILMPFHAMGPMPGSLCWLTFKYMLILAIFWTTAKVSRSNTAPWPAWALVVLLLLSVRVFISDLTHGNVNLLIGGLIAGALLCSYQTRDFLAGLAIGLAAVLKVTPLLFVAYFMYKRRWLSVLGAMVGIALFCWIVPGLILGFEFNKQLTVAWYMQMIHPFITGEPVSYLQTSHMNQSFTGLFYRFLSDSVAVAADARRGYDELRVNFVSLDHHTVSLIVRIASILVVGCLAVFCRTPREDRKHLGNLGEFAMVFLAMLFLSERSWKHHYVLLIFSHGFLLYYLLVMRPTGWCKWVPLSCMALAIFCHSFVNNSTLGHYWSDVAEAYGVYLMGGISLFVGCSADLMALRLSGWPNRFDKAENFR